MSTLEYLIKAYFHQDWVFNGETSADTVAVFTRESRGVLSSCVDEIEVLLADPPGDGQLVARLDSWGCAYRAGDTDQDYLDWLADIRTQLLKHLGAGMRGVSSA